MKDAINLLPATYRRRLMLQRRALHWTVVLCGVLCAGWGWHGYKAHEIGQFSQRLEALLREHRPTQSMLQQLVEMRQTLVDLQQQQAVASELEQQRNALTLLGVISDACQKANGRLRVTKLEVTDFQRNPTEPAQGDTVAEPSGVLLTGESLDNAAVVELLETLEKSGIFGRVELIASTEREGDDSSLRDYRVSCQF